jgi:hypothetical protein
MFTPVFAGAGVGVTPIVRTGDPIPGETTGTQFTFFGAPSINVNGVVAFRSQANQFGIFTGTPGGLITRVAVGSDLAPGLPAGSTFALFDENIPINSQGEVAFTSVYNDPTHPNGGRRGAWSNPARNFQNIITVDDPLVEHNHGGRFNSFGTNTNPLVLTNTGISAYTAWTSTFPGVGSWGIWAGVTKDTTVKVALQDDPAPTLAADTFFDRIDYPVINSSGVLAFHATVKGAGTGIYDKDVIWAGTAGHLQPIARSFSISPGITSRFSAFYPPDISSTGKVAFHASLDSTSPFPQRDGIWVGTAGNLKLIARSGTEAAGTGGATFSRSFSDPLVNANGTVSFTDTLDLVGSVTTSNYNGLWTGIDSNNLTLVARTGDQAPGTPEGVQFSSSDFAHVLNNLGQIAFTASLAGSGVTSNNDTGLWVYDPTKGTQLVAREGQTIEVAPGLSKTIASIALRTGASSGDGRATSLNDNGQLAFTASFTGGIYYGVFVADIGGLVPGDANNDGTVDREDFHILMDHYGQAGTFETGDFNSDSRVNFSDFQILERNFGKSNSEVAVAIAVPEPGMGMIVMLVIMGGLLPRRRNRR